MRETANMRRAVIVARREASARGRVAAAHEVAGRLSAADHERHAAHRLNARADRLAAAIRATGRDVARGYDR